MKKVPITEAKNKEEYGIELYRPYQRCQSTFHDPSVIERIGGGRLFCIFEYPCGSFSSVFLGYPFKAESILDELAE